MISNGRKWHYLAVKNLSALLTGITSKHYGNFYCLNFLHSFRTKNKLESHKKVYEKKDFCKLFENSSTKKVSKHIPSGFSISSFKSIENKHDIYRGKDCMKKFCESLREHSMKIIDFKKK